MHFLHTSQKLLFFLNLFSHIAFLLCLGNEQSQLYRDKSFKEHEKTWNLFGVPGDGYYINAQFGTPPQNVCIFIPLMLMGVDISENI